VRWIDGDDFDLASGQGGLKLFKFAYTARGHSGKTADWLLISRVLLLSADLFRAAQQSLKNYELCASVTQQIQQEMKK